MAHRRNPPRHAASASWPDGDPDVDTNPLPVIPEATRPLPVYRGGDATEPLAVIDPEPAPRRTRRRHDSGLPRKGVGLFWKVIIATFALSLLAYSVPHTIDWYDARRAAQQAEQAQTEAAQRAADEATAATRYVTMEVTSKTNDSANVEAITPTTKYSGDRSLPFNLAAEGKKEPVKVFYPAGESVEVSIQGRLPLVSGVWERDREVECAIKDASGNLLASDVGTGVFAQASCSVTVGGR